MWGILGAAEYVLSENYTKVYSLTVRLKLIYLLLD
jgi:hypothetical protein